MIKTLRSNNGSFANVAVNTQPLSPDDNLQAAAKQQTSQTTHTLSTSVPTAHQVQLPHPVISTDSGGLNVTAEPTLEQIADGLTSESGMIIPQRSAGGNIIPTYPLARDSGKTLDPRLLQNLASTATKFQVYTNLTGITHERPEIVMMTEFLPLYDRATSSTVPAYIEAFEAAGLSHFITDAGRYIDAQFHMRNLNAFNIHRSIESVRTRYAQVEQHLRLREDNFTRAIFSLKDDAGFMLNLVRLVESQKSQLDLRHDLYEVDPTEVATFFLQNFAQQRPYMAPELAPHILSLLVQRAPRPKYNFVDCLTDLGYKENLARKFFSSTKIWLQTVTDLRHILQHHSYRLLDIDPTQQKKDQNPSTILNPPTKRFDFITDLPQVMSLEDLVKLQPAGSAKAVQTLSTAFGKIYQDVFFKNEETKIAALAHLLTREFRYSNGLADPALQRRLSSFYGYQVTPTRNMGLFNSVMGSLVNNISDFPSANLRSVASVGQERVENAGILTFESKFVEGDNGTLTPGSDFYFDRILNTDGSKFDTQAIDNLSKRLQNQADNLSVICDSLNLMAIPSQTVMHMFGLDIPLMLDVSFLENSTDTVHQLVDQLINPRNGEARTIAINDRLGAVYAHARTHPQVKTILFLYTMNRLARTYKNNVPFFSASPGSDNTPIVDKLIDQLVNLLESTVPESPTVVQLVNDPLDPLLNTASLTNDSIKHALKSGTRMTTLVEGFMSDVLNWFRNRSQALSGNLTRYRGAQDTVVAMVAFDLAISIISRYSNQDLVGVHKGLTTFSTGQTTYVVSRNSSNHLTSFNELIQRLSAEGYLTRQLLLTTLNAMRKLSGSLLGISNYLNSKDSLDKLHQISSTLNNNAELIKMLFSEQQIMLLASTVESLLTAHARNKDQKGVGTQRRSYNATGRPTNRETAILDESEVPPEMLKAIMGYFGTGEFAGIHGRNKRILTVGIPQGFTRNLKQKVTLKDQKKASFEDKRSDIVRICVYKLDIQHPDIVYRPVKYLFELSRFPTRFTTAHWLPLPENPALHDIVSAIPTQNFTQDPNKGTSNSIASGVEYASTAIAGSDGIKGARGAFEGGGYDFLSPQQRTEILHNQVVSQLLEAYIKLMTGINVAEHEYHFTPPPPQLESAEVKLLLDHAISHMGDLLKVPRTVNADSPTGGVLFSGTSTRRSTGVTNARGSRGIIDPVMSNPAGVAGYVSPASEFRSVQPSVPSQKSADQLLAIDPAKLTLSSLSARHTDLIMTSLHAISSLSRTMTSFSQVKALNHKVLSPKCFDRVFNVIVDPRDFLVNAKKTNATPHGRNALRQLLETGDIVSSEHDAPTLRALSAGLSLLALTVNPNLGRGFIKSQPPDDVHAFRYRDRDKSQGDLITDKYFITIETLEDDL